MYVQSLAAGAEAVRGIYIAAVLLVEVQTPVVVIRIPEIRQIVYICTLGMDDLAEETLLGHIEARELEEVIDAVLEHHAVAARTLRGVDQLPALGHAHGGGNLHGYVLAVLHGIYCDGHMVHPVGRNIYKVYIVTLAKLLVCLIAYIALGLGEACTLEDSLALVDIRLLKVAKSLDLDALQMRETLHGTRAAHAEADKADTYDRDGVGCKSEHRLLTGGTCRFVEDDHTVLERIVFSHNGTGCPAASRQYGTSHKCASDKQMFDFHDL